MSLGSRFALVVNNGLQDKLLIAHEELQKRIRVIKALKAQKPSIYGDDVAVLPTLLELEKTHETFINNFYKPHIPIAFEYIKCQATVPKFGDRVIFQLPQVGDFVNDMVVHIKISGLRATDSRDRVRYVAFPGHRLIKKAQFLVNKGFVLDEYCSEDYNAFYQYEIPTEAQKKAWCRNVGQELPKLGFLSPDPTFNMQREYRYIGDGHQTLKYSHDTLEMFIPLLFWCRELKSALPSCIIPWGQLQISLDLALHTELIGIANGGGGGDYIAPTIDFCNLYVNTISTTQDIYELYAKKFNFSLIRIHKEHRVVLTEPEGDVLLSNLKHPIENLYFSFRPQENGTLSQHWYKNTKLTEQSYKVPVMARDTTALLTGTITGFTAGDPATATLSAIGLSGVNDTYNNYDFVITGGTGYNSLDITKNRYTVVDYDGGLSKVTLDSTWEAFPAVGTTFELFTPQLGINTVSYYEETPVVTSLSLKAAENALYRELSSGFYNSYLPYRFSGLLSPPEDKGSYFMNFGLRPLEYAPSGSFNVSVCREFYIGYKSDIISKDTPVELIALSRAINALYVRDGTASMKFT